MSEETNAITSVRCGKFSSSNDDFLNAYNSNIEFKKHVLALSDSRWETLKCYVYILSSFHPCESERLKPVKIEKFLERCVCRVRTSHEFDPKCRRHASLMAEMKRALFTLAELDVLECIQVSELHVKPCS